MVSHHPIVAHSLITDPVLGQEPLRVGNRFFCKFPEDNGPWRERFVSGYITSEYFFAATPAGEQYAHQVSGIDKVCPTGPRGGVPMELRQDGGVIERFIRPSDAFDHQMQILRNIWQLLLI